MITNAITGMALTAVLVTRASNSPQISTLAEVCEPSVEVVFLVVYNFFVQTFENTNLIGPLLVCKLKFGLSYGHLEMLSLNLSAAGLVRIN